MTGHSRSLRGNGRRLPRSGPGARFLIALALLIGIDGAQRPAELQSCVQTQGYWRTHPNEWPVEALVLGQAANPAHTYSKTALLTLLGSSSKGDASLVLAGQLIAAKLNVASGSNPAPVAAELLRADQLLADFPGRLPLGVKSSTAVGQDMTAVGRRLEDYNRGLIPGTCGTQNTRPVANAGPDQTVARGSLVALDGSGSNDVDGDALTFAWSFQSRPAGSAATLSDPTAVRPTFVADAHGDYVLVLVVSDGQTGSAPASVRISTVNSRPVADAGADMTPRVGDTVTLDGTGSHDADGDALTFAWTLVERPATSTAVLVQPSSPTPSLAIDAPGRYVVQLVVHDGIEVSDPDLVEIATDNTRPVANAGPDQNVDAGDTVRLDGSASTDVDGDLLSYQWSLITRPPASEAALSNPAAVQPTFTADLAGTYVAQLIVNDGTFDSLPDAVVITVAPAPNARPVAAAGPDQTIPLGEVVQLDGRGSSDADGDPLAFHWSFLSRPDGSAAALSDPFAVDPIFVVDVAGAYLVQLIVNDGLQDSEPDTVTITTENSRPVADAGPDQQAGRGATVLLDGRGSSDPDGTPLAFAWSLLSRPEGSAAALGDPQVVAPTFVADLPGVYVAQLIVSDGALDSLPDTVTVTVPNGPPVADAGTGRVVDVGETVLLDGSASTDPDGDPLTYEWAFVSVPAGSTAALSDAAAAAPSFVVDLRGSYVVRLVVHDGFDDSEPVTITFATEDTVPIADAGPDRTVATGTTVQLDGSGSHDPDGTPIAEYAWTLISRPAGSSAALSNAGIVNPTFVADVAGTYVAELVVGDGGQTSSPDSVTITVEQGADLLVRYNSLPVNPPVGSQVTLRVEVLNLGPGPTSDVAALFALPAGYTYLNHAFAASYGSTAGFTYVPSTGAWSVGAMPPGNPNGGILARVSVNARVNHSGPYDLVAAIAGSSAPDPNPSNDRVEAVIAPNFNADLSVSIFPSHQQFPDGVAPVGASLGWIVDIRNAGPASARDVRVHVPLPAGATYTSHVLHAGGPYDPVTGEWLVGDAPTSVLAGRLILSARLAAVGPTEFTATIVNSSGPDPNPANNSVTTPRLNRRPISVAGADQSAATNTTVLLDGSQSFDGDGDPITYQWTFYSRPVNSTAILAGAGTVAPTFVPDLGGPYVPRLVVTDSFGVASVPDDVTIAAVVTNQPPVIRSGPVTQGLVGQAYQYAVLADDPDPGDVLTFALPVAPAGMTIDPLAGTIVWTPDAAQGGPRAVLLRVTDLQGLFAEQGYVVQVSSPSNPAPVARDDAYEVRVTESLGVAAPGVLENDTDESPLKARLLSGPSNGTLLFNEDGSFVYTPHTQQPGELVQTGDVNLLTVLPGVVVRASAFNQSNSSCGTRCGLDDNPGTVWGGGTTTTPFLEVEFPQEVTVSAVQIVGTRNTFFANQSLLYSAGVVQLFANDGRELFTSGNASFAPPSFDAHFNVPGVANVRRVRFSPTASAGGTDAHLFGSVLADLRVVGSTLLRRERAPEPNVAVLLPTAVTASSFVGFNVPQSVVDDRPGSNWWAAGAAGEFIELAFPADVTVTALEVTNASSLPGGGSSSNGFNCFGGFTLHDAAGAVVFDSGTVNVPRGFLGGRFDLTVPAVGGVRRLRYISTGCPNSSFGPAFDEIRVIGAAEVETPAFALAKKFHALAGREAHSTPIVVNLTDDNGDGIVNASDIPDILLPVENATSQLRGDIKVISGDDGRELFTIGENEVSPWSDLAAGDLDGDGVPEIVAVAADGEHLIAFDFAGGAAGVKWTSDANPMPVFTGGLVGGTVSIANLDGVGPPEVILGASVFDAAGRLIGDGRALGGTTGGTGLRSAISTVADIDLDGQPELVAGPTAYRLVNGSLSKVWQRTDRADGYAAVANFDDDPEAEIAIVARGTVYLLNHDGTDAAVWNPPGHGPVPLPGPEAGDGGAPLVVDVDGDGLPEIGVAGGTYFTLFNRDGSIRWKAPVSDRSSHSTGSIAFDLDGDGQVEIIYRDEVNLRVYRGSDGVLLAKLPVQSATWAEIPVVADVDNDGHADIVVSSDRLVGSEFNTGILVLTDAANRWMRTRRIWNQHAYHVTNVNEDASIPAVETPHWLVPGLNAFRTNAFVPGESSERADGFTYVATDGALESDAAAVRIAVRVANAPPQITSSPVVSAAVGVLYTYAVRAHDPDAGDILAFSLPAAPAGMSIEPTSGVIHWVPEAGDAGTQQVVVKVQDLRGLFALQGYSVTVAAPVVVPHVVGLPQADAAAEIVAANLVVGAISTRHSATVPEGAVLLQNPAGGTPAAPGAAVTIVVSLGPVPPGTVPDVVGLAPAAAQSEIAASGFTTGAVTAQHSLGVAAGLVLAQDPAAGALAQPGTAIGLVVSLGPPPPDGGDAGCAAVPGYSGAGLPPLASLESPAEDAEITMPADLLGWAVSENFLRYRLCVAEAGSGVFRQVAEAATPVLNDGVLGRFDPTVLENGLYTVRLVVEDADGIDVDERTFRVSGGAKVGVLAMSFVDLRVPVSGIPITVVRSYDSRVRSQREFGVGWSLDVAAGKYRHNRVPGDGWTINDQPFPGGSLPCIGGTTETRSHVTEVRLSDRESYVFALDVTNGNLGITGACEGVAAFRFVSGTMPGATLEILDSAAVIYLRGGPDEVLDMNAFLDGETRVYNPRRVRLTTIDGRRIDLEAGAGITRIADPNGHALTITPGGIVHSSGKSIAFSRDALGRITSITDPLGHELSYAYDEAGDLREFVDQAGNRTTFRYEDHRLIELIDPLGNRALSATYDAQGRVIALVDAEGRLTQLAHDIDGRQEIVTDSRGHVTLITYSDRGDVVRTEAPVTIEGVVVPAVTSYGHDASGNQTVVVDPDGVRVEAAYDHANPLEEIVDPAGLALRTSYTYDARGEMLTQVDPAGHTLSFEHDGAGNLTRLTDPAGSATTLVNDSSGRPIEATDASGARTRLLYDSAGRIVRQERFDPAGAAIARVDFTHDANGNQLSRVERRTIDGVPRLLATGYAYDAKNRIIATTDPLGGVTRVEYNAIGREAARIDALGRRTSFTYDALGALVGIVHPDGSTEARAYDESGNVVSETDAAGRVTRYEYDELRRRVKVTRPDGTTTHTVYTPAGRKSAEIDARGARTDYEYDTAGRPIRTRRPPVTDAVSGTVRRPETVVEYDAAGRITAVVDANGARTTLGYDGMGRVTAREYADGTRQESGYDAVGRLIERRDEAGRLTRFEYDAMGRLTRTIDALGGVTSYAYDEAGHLLSQTDPLGRVTQHVHDALGRLVRRRLPSGRAESFAYDAAGNILARTSFSGEIVRFDHDPMDRVLRRRYPDGSETTFTYGATGRRTSATDARGTTTFEYDLNDRLVRTTHPGGEVVEYAYDDNGSLRQLRTPAAVVDYERDALNRVVGVEAALNGAPLGTWTNAYDLADGLIEQVAPNGVTTRRTYDARRRLLSVTHVAGGAPLASFAYDLSPTGRRTRVTEADGSIVNYGYDALDRLVSEERVGSPAVTYEYDAAGNRLRMTRNGVAISYAYDADDRLLTAGSTTYAYDDNGNLLSRADALSNTLYEWNLEDRLVRASGAGGTVEFQYDADGNRVSRQAGGALTRFLVDANNPTGLSQVLEERSGAGDLVAQYTYGTSLLSGTRGAGTAFHLPDGLGSTRLLTDAAGTTTDAYRFGAFGTLEAATGSTPNPYLFAGEQFEPSAGFYNLRARSYDMITGRFISRDPVPGQLDDARSQHPYLYAHADPVNTTDPTGLFSLIEISTSLGIQDVLRGLDYSLKVARACATTGKLELAQEAFFWAQFAAAAPILASEIFGVRKADKSFEVAFTAKRHLKVFRHPEKIVEAKASVEFTSEGEKTLSAEFTREDGFPFGGTIGLVPAKWPNLRPTVKGSFKSGAFAFGLGDGGPSVGLSKSFPLYEIERCEVPVLKASFKLGGKVGLGGPEVEAAVAVEGAAGLASFSYTLVKFP